MKIGLAQIDSHLGSFSENREKILTYIQKGKAEECEIVVFPELALFGYLPMDLLERETVFQAQWSEFKKLEKNIPKGMAVFVGLVTPSEKKFGKPYRNSVALLQAGKKTKFFHKELLPNYDIFDDPRFFDSPKDYDNIVKIGSKKILVTICEDIWGWGQELENANYSRNPITSYKRKGIDLVLNLSASPFSKGHWKRRLQVVRKTAALVRAPVVYVNMVGAQDEIIFDGGSFAVDAKGLIAGQASNFSEEFYVLDMSSTKRSKKLFFEDVELIRKALVVGIRDFVHKAGFKKVHLGLSGGIDSALVACLAVEALGAENVCCIALPGPFSSQKSYDLAKVLASCLKCEFKKVDIEAPYKQVLSSMSDGLGESEFGVMNENLQSRLRGMVLMAHSNREGSMLLTTGNKSEYATGYATLYGDMCGGLAPIGDLLKTEVYALSNHYNRNAEIIPQEIIDRPPTAELRPNQKDQDTLPPYEELDAAIERVVVNRKAAKSKTERWLLEMLKKTEFKRWQAPPILRISQRSFGKGRRYPIAHKALF